MVIGIVVNVLEEEQAKLDTEDPERTSLANLRQELAEIKSLVQTIETRLGDQAPRTPSDRSGRAPD